MAMEKRSEVEIANIVADYWLNFLIDPTTAKFDNGSDNKASAVAQMAFNIAKASQKPIEASKLEMVKNKLLVKLLNSQPSGIHVDYSPGWPLYEVLDEVLGEKGWNHSTTFPCKTNMYINWYTGHIEVSEGYRAPSKEL